MKEQKIKENLWRLWSSADVANHEVAIRLFQGIQPTLEEYKWLWHDIFPKISSLKQERTNLANFPNISIWDALQGKLLTLLLQQEEISVSVLNHYTQHDRLRLPYTTLEHIPNTFQPMAYIQEIIWQDGELTRIDENIACFKNVKRIDFRRQPITFIHPNLATLPQLEELYLISTSFLPDEILDRRELEIFTDAPY